MQKSQVLSQNGSINFSEALNRMGGDAPFLYELLNDYINEFKGYYESVINALIENDFDEITIVGHTLKGSSAMLSLTRMHSFSAQLENAGKDNNMDEAKRIVKLMNAEFATLTAILSVSPETVN
jgi:HPt (histidine-containing phosphotransfer) domain-containing protein